MFKTLNILFTIATVKMVMTLQKTLKRIKLIKNSDIVNAIFGKLYLANNIKKVFPKIV